MTFQEAGEHISHAAYHSAIWALWFVPAVAGAGLWLVGEVSPSGWAEFFKSFGVLGALVFYMGWNLIYGEPRREKAQAKTIKDILDQHREDRKEDRAANKENSQRLCESIDKNTEAFSRMCEKLGK